MATDLHDLIKRVNSEVIQLQGEKDIVDRELHDYPAFKGHTTLAWHEWNDRRKYLESEQERLAREIRHKRVELDSLQEQKQLNMFPKQF